MNFSNDAVWMCEPYKAKLLDGEREIPITIFGHRIHVSDGVTRPMVICESKDSSDVKRILGIEDVATSNRES